MSGCCKSDGLVQIGAKSVSEESTQVDVESSQPLVSISRRGFLKGLGVSSAVGLTSCANDVSQKIYPNVKGEGELIPGVAVWYSTTCTECSAGCGVQVRTREGRAVKVEGNPLHPVNKGSLCGLGQASLQHLYDPDRIRQPLKRVSGPSEKNPRFEPVGWDEAFKTIADALAEDKNAKYFITGELGGGSLERLAVSFAKENGFEHISYDALSAAPFAKASEKVFGVYGIPELNFAKADVVVNFGADFLETWVSPCQYAKDWSEARKREIPLRVVHFEPRASLTAGNADEFHSITPGSELNLAKALLKAVSALKSVEGSAQAKNALASLDMVAVATEAGVSVNVIEGAAKALVAAGSSLVLSGGTLGLTAQAQELAEICLVINSVLGNVGKTLDYSKVRTPKSSVEKLVNATKVMNEKKAGVLFVYDTNPAFTLPSSFGFNYAARYVPLVVSFSSHLDETAQLASLILPANTALESWGDTVPYTGLYNLMQPVMVPIFDTKHIGDLLIKIATDSGKKISDGAPTFYEYLRAEWKKLQTQVGSAGDFETFWKGSVEKGGIFKGAKTPAVPATKLTAGSYASLAVTTPTYDTKNSGDASLVVYPFTSVKSFDGRAANRPWLQELPDPVTKVVWDSWAEIHPKTAKRLGLAAGDVTTIRNFYGEVNLPVYITPYVHEQIVAIPLGTGHSAYGRYAEAIEGGNAFSLLPSVITAGGTMAAALSTKAEVLRARGRSSMIVSQGSFDQLGRGIARSSYIEDANNHAAHDEPAHGASHAGEEHGAHGGGGGHQEHEPYPHGEHGEKTFYKQREHPLYEWGMVVDLNACTGCSACIVACYAENNVPVVGKEACKKGREMSWLRIERYDDGGADELQVNYLPMMCQHCHNAPCEPVCPVYATYHNEEGLNAMIYNRCVGTRYCSNNCTYKVRRFNFAGYDLPTPLDWQLNPDVTQRGSGVMEKCTFCVQRIIESKDTAKDEGRIVRDGEVIPACVQGCPTEALSFGNKLDPESKINKIIAANRDRAYKVLDESINTQPAITYLGRRRYKNKVATQV